MTRYLYWWGLFLALLPVRPTFAFDEFSVHSQTPRSLGAGGAYVSIVDDASAFQLNPAGISRHAETRNFYFSNEFVNRFSKWGLKATVIDGITEDPLHWGFQFETVHTPNIKEEKYIFGTSYNYENFILVGVTNQFNKFHHAILTSNPWIFSMNLGVLIFAGDYFSIGASLLNPIRSIRDSVLDPVKAVIGLGLNLKYARSALEVERNFSKDLNTVRAGIEIQPIVSELTLRIGGYRVIHAGTYGYTLGMTSTFDPRFGIDLGFLDQLKSDFRVFSGGIQVRL